MTLSASPGASSTLYNLSGIETYIRIQKPVSTLAYICPTASSTQCARAQAEACAETSLRVKVGSSSNVREGTLRRVNVNQNWLFWRWSTQNHMTDVLHLGSKYWLCTLYGEKEYFSYISVEMIIWRFVFGIRVVVLQSRSVLQRVSTFVSNCYEKWIGT